MTQSILVTGATGNVGFEVLRGLAGHPDVRAAVLDPARLEKPLEGNARLTTFDFLRPETFAAFDGVESLFLMRPPAISNIDRDMRPALEAAEAAGVRHVVFLSLLGAEHNRIVPHAKIEALLEKSGMAYTFLRAGFFMQNLNTTHRAEIRERNEIFIPAGSGKTSFTDVRDLGAVAAKVLLENGGHDFKKYSLTGSEALTYTEVAAILSEELGRPIRYAHPLLVSFAKAQKDKGYPWDYVLVTSAIYTTARLGLAGTVTDEIERLLGRPPITVRQYVHDYRDYWLTSEQKPSP